MTNLDETLDVFEDEAKETKAKAKEPKAEPKAEPKGETEETEEAKAEAETKDAEPPSAEEEKLVPIVALHDERTKRQAIEEELKSYKSKYDVDKNAPDPAEDPEAYKLYVREEAKKELHMDNIETSRSLMMESHRDYAEKEKSFMFLTQYDESLINQMNKHPDPARFAYEKGKAYMDDQREKLRAEIVKEAKDNAIQEETSEEEGRKESALGVPDLTKAASAGANSDPAEIDNKDNLTSVFDD